MTSEALLFSLVCYLYSNCISYCIGFMCEVLGGGRAAGCFCEKTLGLPPYYHTLLLIDNKLISQNLLCPWWWVMSLSHPISFCIIVSHPSLLRQGEWKSILVATLQPAKVNLPQPPSPYCHCHMFFVFKAGVNLSLSGSSWISSIGGLYFQATKLMELFPPFLVTV